MVGFEAGFIQIFKAESASQKCLSELPFAAGICTAMELSHLERPANYHYLIVKVTRSEELQDGGNEMPEENSIIDGEQSEVFIIKGYKKFEEKTEKIALNRCMPNQRDQVFLATSGIFMLYEKYYTLDQLTFTTQDESGKPLEYSGEKIAEEL